jgi:hypothetical protein
MEDGYVKGQEGKRPFGILAKCSYAGLCWRFELLDLTGTRNTILWNYFVHALLGSGTDMQLWRGR